MPVPRDPSELRLLSLQAMEALAEDLRQRIVEICLKNGGHLGASLGTVELAIALHAIFRSPEEPIIWDVGHQAYGHKLLTGRWQDFATLRQFGGTSGFLSRDESEHDVFGAGHSSTSLSAALAMAWAAGRSGTEPAPWTVAVIGDGGLTAGVAFEALNNLKGQPIGPLLIVVNDNQMSIAPNVGAISNILIGGDAGSYFASFGAEYIGPIDGHDLRTLLDAIGGARAAYSGRPIVLHVHTQKGRGYLPAEQLPAHYHGVSPVQEKIPGAAPAPKHRTFSEEFGRALCELAAADPRVVAVTAAMTDGTGLVEFAREFPDRFFDVGIAEGHAVTFAAGLAARGFRPVVAVYSTFLQRGLDAVIHDVALQRLPVTFAVDRAGLVGADGPTHHGAFDLAYLGAVPGLEILAPTCLSDLASGLKGAIAANGPVVLRYPRGGGPERLDGTSLGPHLKRLGPATGARLRVVALGASASRATEAVRAVDPGNQEVALYLCGSAKPVPAALVSELSASPLAPVLVVEDGSIRGGFGQALRQELPGLRALFEIAGYPDFFIPHGSPARLEELARVSATALTERIRKLMGTPKS